MHIGLIGAGQRGARRAAALAALCTPDVGVAFVGVTDADADAAQAVAAATGAAVYPGAQALLEEVDAVCIAVPTRDHYLLAETAVKRGRHVFVEWPPTTSIPECEALVRLAEEAHVEIGVAHPFPTAALRHGLPATWTPRLLALTLYGDPTAEALGWPARLAGALDLFAALARTANVQRMDAEAERAGVILDTVTFSVRFRNGTYAQARLHERPPPTGEPTCALYAAGSGQEAHTHRLDAPLTLRPRHAPVAVPLEPLDADLLEMTAFVGALAAGQSAPRTILDALHTLRLTERLLSRLR